MPAYTPPAGGTGVTVGGSPVVCPRPVRPRRLIPHVHKGTPSFSFEVKGGLPTLPDPYLGKEVKVYIKGTLRFTGDVISRHPAWTKGVGQVVRYQCLGLRYRGDLAPHTDTNTGTDSTTFNAQADNQSLEYRPALAGRTVGQILTAVLTMVDNAQALDALGVGNYTGLPSAPALPSQTVTDLAGLTRVPPSTVRFSGEKLLSAVEAFLSTWAPNWSLWVAPNGTIRFFDLRSPTNRTFTQGTDPVRPALLSRDLTECAGRVLVRGQPLAQLRWFGVNWGTLFETPFAHDGLTVAQAKAAFTTDDFTKPKTSDEGNCSCLSTTTIRLTSADVSKAWPSGYWDQAAGNHHGTLFLTYSAGTGITTQHTARIVSCPALTAGGHCDVQVDLPLPHLNFNHYGIRGNHDGTSSVWREYALPAWAGPLVAKQATYGAEFRLASGPGATWTSTPMGLVLWSQSNSPPYWEAGTGVVVDQDAGTVTFSRPTFMTAGNRAPSDVRVLVPINTGANRAVYPADVAGLPSYGGTGYTVEGLQRTLIVTVPAWRDPAQVSAMTDYAQDLFQSVSEPVVEGEVEYLGLVEQALTPGMAVSVAGTGYVTGWESAALPNLETQLEWSVDGLTYLTTMKASSRRAHFTDAAFSRPDRTGVTFDWSGELDLSPLATGTPAAAGLGVAGGSLAAGISGSGAAAAAGFGGGVTPAAFGSAAAAGLAGEASGAFDGFFS
jgi:hypothetical protein